MSKKQIEDHIKHLEHELDFIEKDDLTGLGQAYVALCRVKEQLED